MTNIQNRCPLLSARRENSFPVSINNPASMTKVVLSFAYSCASYTLAAPWLRKYASCERRYSVRGFYCALCTERLRLINVPAANFIVERSNSP